MKTIFVLMCLLFAHASFGIPSSSKNEDGSFKITDNSLKHMGIAFQQISGVGPWEIPTSALVKIKFTNGVYRYFQGSISYVLINIVSRKGETMVVESEDLASGDKVAISGIHFLRLTEADLNSGSVDSCSH